MPFFWRNVKTADGVTRVPYVRVYFKGTDRARSIRHLWNQTKRRPPPRILALAEAELYKELQRPPTKPRGDKRSEALVVGEEYLDWVRANRSEGHLEHVDFAVRNACEHIGRDALEEWALQDLEEYLRQGRTGTGWAKKRRPWSARTYNLHLGMISHFLSWAVKRRRLDSNPAREVEKIRVDRKQPQYIAEGEMAKLLKAFRAQDEALPDRPWSLEHVVLVDMGTARGSRSSWRSSGRTLT